MRRETRRSRDWAKIHPCIDAEHFPGKHRQLNEDDVSHREKRRQTGEHFGADVGSVVG